MRTLILTITFLATSFSACAQNMSQCFSNFSTEVFNSKEKPSLKLNSDTKNFETVITKSYEGSSSNFGGHYLIVSWGCGTSCQSHAIINLKTGKAEFLPFVTSLGLSHQANSNLLIVDPNLESAKKEQEYLKGETEYYKMENDSLVQFSESNLPKSCHE